MAKEDNADRKESPEHPLWEIACFEANPDLHGENQGGI